MRYAAFADTGWMVSRVGFGAIPIRRCSYREAERVIHRSIDAGINFFDTARSYGDSEEKLGRALLRRRGDLIIATKTTARTAPEAAADLETSLKNLRTDYVDLIQLHNVRTGEDFETVMGPEGALRALSEARDSGKVRHIGVSSHDPETSLRAIESGEFVSIMVPHNFMETEFEDEVIPAAACANMAVIGMKPFAGGVLEKARLALGFVLTVPGMTVAIPGMATVEEVTENAGLAETVEELSRRDQAELEEVRRELGTTFCRACDYCQPCPEGIKISSVLRSERGFRRLGVNWIRERLADLTEQVERCTECETCIPRCPYDLDIPRLLREKVAFFRQQLDS